jgi:RHS repeat-associated protein
LTTYGGISHTYNYPTGTNNGKISSAVVSGETITYQYDSLNRVMSASGSGWGDSYGYDAFGSLLSKTITSGTPPSLSQAVNPLNNWITGQSYDPNGNQLTAPGVTGSLTYDAENHMVAAPGIQYAYDSQNMRVWSGTLGSGGSLQTQTVYFYGADGHKLGSYAPAWAYNGGTPALSDSAIETESYFAGKRVAITSGSGSITSFSQDRLGSNAASNVSLYPWGEDRGTPAPNDQVKFATYTRDSVTMLDYANQRYYVNNQGRFMTPDPYTNSGRLSDPQSWNRYAYTTGDPVNFIDPAGLAEGPPESTCVINGVTYSYSSGICDLVIFTNTISYRGQPPSTTPFSPSLAAKVLQADVKNANLTDCQALVACRNEFVSIGRNTGAFTRV